MSAPEEVHELDRQKAAFLAGYRELCEKHQMFVVMSVRCGEHDGRCDNEDCEGYMRFVVAAFWDPEEEGKLIFEQAMLELQLEDGIFISRT